MGQCEILLQAGRGMSWGRRCSPGVCSSSSTCGVMAGAAPGVSSKLLSSSLPFLDQPILPLCGPGDSVPGGQCSHSQLPCSTPSYSTGKEVHFNSWTGLASTLQAARGQSSTYTDPHTHQQQPGQTTTPSKCAGKKDPHEAWTRACVRACPSYSRHCVTDYGVIHLPLNLCATKRKSIKLQLHKDYTR